MSTVIIGGGGGPGGHGADVKADFYIALRPDFSECVGVFQSEDEAKAFAEAATGVWRIIAGRTP